MAKVFKPSKNLVRGVPIELEKNEKLLQDISALPQNYNFEIPKTIWRIKQNNCKHIALQFPEGLLLFATHIADILEEWTSAEVTIMGDITYGACCVDDFTAKAVGADFLVHYGHSCLIPIDQTGLIPILYVFVDIQFDMMHLIDTIKSIFKQSQPLALVSIIQFVASLHKVAEKLRGYGYTVDIPQSHPLSPGEVLGCTSPPVKEGYTIICLGDGRFHLESIMISNPEIPTFLYNPYLKIMTQEYYDQPLMKKMRRHYIDEAAKAKKWGIILGTLGRQGNLGVLQSLQDQFRLNKIPHVVVLMSEVFPKHLCSLPDIEAWVQIACPRLSIDWGESFPKPCLTPYEASVALKTIGWDAVSYPMDFYANDSLGPWTPNHKPKCPCGRSRKTGCKGLKCPAKLDTNSGQVYGTDYVVAQGGTCNVSNTSHSPYNTTKSINNFAHNNLAECECQSSHKILLDNTNNQQSTQHKSLNSMDSNDCCSAKSSKAVCNIINNI